MFFTVERSPDCGSIIMKSEVIMKRTLVICFALFLTLASCSASHDHGEISYTPPSSDSAAIESSGENTGIPLPQSNEVLFSELLKAWRSGNVEDYYEYVSSDFSALVGKTEFGDIFSDFTEIYGEIKDFEKAAVKKEAELDVFSFKVKFENAVAEMTVSIKNLKISGITNDVRITNTFDKKYEGGITERYFVLESGEYSLNAVYTFSDRGSSPAALLIPGSGPSDIDETVGFLKPFRDLAVELAGNGVNSLRVEKRTNRYAEKFTPKDGLNEEYYEDLTAAYNWLKSQKETREMFLIGHSLGGQIAVELSKTCDASGLILWNSSLRHLAEIAADQYILTDKANEAVYRKYENAAKSAVTDTSDGFYYFGASDYYWSSYNEIDTLKTLENSTIPYLVINSKADLQTFPKDIKLWQSALGHRDNMTAHVFDDQSHWGYKIDLADSSAYYRKAVLPDELISIIVGFIRNGTFRIP